MSFRDADELFASLIQSLSADLHKIANGSNKEISVEELHAETWIAAAELSEEHEGEPELSGDSFREEILGRLWRKFGRYVDRPLKFAYRLDEEWADEDGMRENGVAASLQAPASLEPEAILIARQEAVGNDEETRLGERFA